MAMDESRLIVVGADGSDRSIDAVRWAIDEAEVHGGTVRILVAWEVPATTIYLTPTSTESDYADQARAAMKHVWKEVGADNRSVPVEAELVMGKGGDVLVSASKGADLLVVGSHGLGHGELPGVHLGSVASYCVHHATCPTVVVRTE